MTDTPLGTTPNLLVVDDNTWPWQLAGIQWKEGAAGRVVRFNPYTWRNDTRDNGPVAESPGGQRARQPDSERARGQFRRLGSDPGK